MSRITPLAQAVDGELAELDYQRGTLTLRIDILRRNKVRSADNEQELFQLGDKLHMVNAKIAPLSDVYRTYNWTRAYLVPGGHAHWNYNCHSLYPETTRVIVPECSGLTEDEIVELAGDRACTVCYPSAPVDVLTRKSQLFTRDEREAEEARVAKAAKRAAKEAAKITVVFPGAGRNGRDLTETYGTERTARIEAVDAFWWTLFGENQKAQGGSGASIKAHQDKAFRIVEAIAAKTGVRVDELAVELAAKAKAKWDEV